MRKSTHVLLTAASALLLATLITGCSAKARMVRHQQRADKYFEAGEYSKAEIEYLVALRLESSNPHSVTRLGEIYFNQGRFGIAHAYLKKASEIDTNNVEIHVKLGTIYLMKRMTKECQAEASLILDRSPTNAEAPELMAESLASVTDLERVRARLEKLSKQIGDTASLEIAFGVLDYGAKDPKASEAAFKRAITIDPKSASAYAALGNIYRAQNKMKDAEQAFKTSADLSPIRSVRRLNYANFEIQNGNLDEGKRLIAEITKAAPDYLPAWLRSAEIALAERKYDECEALLTQALGRDADNYDALLLRGRVYLAQNQGDKAVAELDRMASLYNQSPEVQYYLGLAHLAVNDPVKASSDLSKALFLRPNYPEATVTLAQLNISKGDAASAISSLTQLLSQTPGIAEPYVLLGSAFVVQKNLGQALVTYAQMEKYFPESPQPPLLSGMVLMRQQKPEEARKMFERALKLAPDLIVVKEQLVNLDIDEAKFDDALVLANAEIARKPGAGPELLLAKIHIARAANLTAQAAKTNSAVHNMGDVPQAQDDFKAGEAALNKAIELAPNMDGPYLLLSQLYLTAGKPQAALDRLNALVSKTNDVSANMQIGMLYDSIKDYPKARDAYEKVIAAQPDFGPALNNLSYLYSERLNDVEKGYALAEKARKLDPNSASIADTLGWILYKKGDYTRARGLLQESAGKMSQAEVQFHLGMVLYMLGDETPARTALQRAADSKATFAGKDEAVRRLAILAVDPKTADEKTRADFEKRLQDDPNDPVVAIRLAAIYERDGALDKAAKTYEQTLKQNPQNAQIMSRLARIYANLNQADKALEMAKNAHKLAPDDAATSYLLGHLVFLSGDYTWAVTLLQDAAPRFPNQPDVQYDLAWSYYAVGRVSDAEKTMQSIAPALTGAKLADGKQLLAMIAAAKSPTPAATAQAVQILSANANYVPAIMLSALQADQLGKSDDAAKLYERVLARYPAFSPAARNLTILYAQHPADDQKAYDLGMKARAVYPDDIGLERALGVLAYRRADYSRATQLLQESSQTFPQDGELFYYLGMAQYQLKHKPESKAALQRALTLNIQSKSADDARKVLAELK